jgi:hypothetical protein
MSEGTPINAPFNYGGLMQVAEGIPGIAHYWYGDNIEPLFNPLRPPFTTCTSCKPSEDKDQQAHIASGALMTGNDSDVGASAVVETSKGVLGLSIMIVLLILILAAGYMSH